jgi:2-polyprenyl-3-methyl-5-hydroxy-6-metoxy-1,4-benzoquinol methylase
MIHNWFEHWFDSPLHEQLYAKRDAEEANRLAELISGHIPAEEYPRLLDLACGRGRHSINFANRGYRVTGIDLAPTAIERAKAMAAQADVQIDFRVADMREPVNETFDVIVNLFTSFGYFANQAENELPLAAMAKMVRKGGQVWIDFLNPGNVRANLVPTDEGSIPDWSYSIRRWIEDGAVRKEIHLIQDATGNEQIFTEYVRLLALEWFEQTATKYGLTLQAVFGDYEGNPYDATRSPRMIMKLSTSH